MMNREQKVALSLVVTTLAAVVASTVAILILYRRVGMPEALKGLAFMALSGLGCLSMFIFKKEKGKVTFDERDKLIQKRAAKAGFTAAFLVTGACCMTPFFVLGPKAMVPVTWLTMVWFCTFITQFFVYSLALLVQYGWRDKDNE